MSTMLEQTALFSEIMDNGVYDVGTPSNYGSNFLFLKNHSNIEHNIKITALRNNKGSPEWANQNPTHEYLENTNTLSVKLSADLSDVVSDHFVYGVLDKTDVITGGVKTAEVDFKLNGFAVGNEDINYALAQEGIIIPNTENIRARDSQELVNCTDVDQTILFKVADIEGVTKAVIAPKFSTMNGRVPKYNPNFNFENNSITLTPTTESNLFGSAIVITHSNHEGFTYPGEAEGSSVINLGVSLTIPGIEERIKLVSSVRNESNFNDALHEKLRQYATTTYPDYATTLDEYLNVFFIYAFVNDDTAGSMLIETGIGGVSLSDHQSVADLTTLQRLEIIIHPEDELPQIDGHPTFNIAKNGNITSLVGGEYIHKDYKVFAVKQTNDVIAE